MPHDASQTGLKNLPKRCPEPIAEIVPLRRKGVKDRRLMTGQGIPQGLRQDAARTPCQLEGAAWRPGCMSAASAFGNRSNRSGLETFLHFRVGDRPGSHLCRLANQPSGNPRNPSHFFCRRTSV